MPRYNIIKSIDDIDRGKWNNFVYNHANGNIFQTPEYYESIKSQQNINPLSILITNNNNEIIGVLIGEHLFEKKFYSQFTNRAIFRGGPLLKDNSKELFKIILEEYKKLFGSQIIYSEFRQVGTISTFPKLNYNKLIAEKRLNIIFSLSKSETELYGLLHSSRRRQIKRGYRRGLTLEINNPNNEALIQKCYEILLNLYNKIKLPVPSLAFFISASYCLNQYLKIFTIYYKQELVGFRFVLCYKDLMYDWYAASKEDHYDKYPNDILPWEVIKWGSNNGFKYFDFGGAGRPDEQYGVREYKIKFGGELVTTYRYKIIHKPFLFKTGNLGLILWRKLK